MQQSNQTSSSVIALLSVLVIVIIIGLIFAFDYYKSNEIKTEKQSVETAEKLVDLAKTIGERNNILENLEFFLKFDIEKEYRGLFSYDQFYTIQNNTKHYFNKVVVELSTYKNSIKTSTQKIDVGSLAVDEIKKIPIQKIRFDNFTCRFLILQSKTLILDFDANNYN